MKQVGCFYPESSQPLVGNLDIDLWVLLAENRNFLYSVDPGKALPQRFRFQHEAPVGKAFCFQGIHGEIDIGKFVIQNRTDHTVGQINFLIPQLFSCLVELFRHIMGRRSVFKLKFHQEHAGVR